MTDHTDIAAAYVDIWNTTDDERRRKLIAELFAPDATYTDPLGAVACHEGIDGFIAGAQEQFAGMVFSLGENVDGHHDLVRFQWLLGAPGDEEPLVIGFDVIRIGDDGRIGSVAGFLDRMPG